MRSGMPGMLRIPALELRDSFLLFKYLSSGKQRVEIPVMWKVGSLALIRSESCLSPHHFMRHECDQIAKLDAPSNQDNLKTFVADPGY